MRVGLLKYKGSTRLVAIVVLTSVPVVWDVEICLVNLKSSFHGRHPTPPKNSGDDWGSVVRGNHPYPRGAKDIDQESSGPRGGENQGRTSPRAPRNESSNDRPNLAHMSF